MKNVKRIIAVTIIFMISFAQLGSFQVDSAFKAPFEIVSNAAYMVNTDTDTVVFEKNAQQKTYPASLTKIMTAIIALEHVQDLEGTVVTAPSYIYDEFAGMNVSTADIRRGEQVRMIDLLYAMILPSACEASNIIADYVGKGSIPDFVEMMNQKAKEIGAVNTHFTNAHGLFDKDQVTTAYDMYLIAKYAMAIPMFEKISSTPSYLMPVTNKHAEERYAVHTNSMLSKNRGGKYYYKDMKGVKTGSLPEIGKNLITTVSRDGYNYMLVTIGAATSDKDGKPYDSNKSYDDAIALYNWALSNFSQQKILKENETIDEVPVTLSSQQDYVTLVATKDVIALLPSDVEPSAVQRTITTNPSVVAPIKKGDVLGKLELKLADDIIASIDLVAKEDVKRNQVLYILDIVKRFLSKPSIIILLVILFLLLFLYSLVALRYKKIQRQRAMRSRNNMRMR
ncbi:MAG: D-alanyl-D-alanine carboxypeptidase family protein [Oscillospiraceae bacterium]